MNRQLHHVRQGQSMIEIGLIIALVAAIAVVGVTATGTSTSTTLCRVVNTFGDSSGCGVLFADTFANLNAWQIAAGTWASVNGALNGGPKEGRVFVPLKANDYTITVDSARLTEGNGYGVFFRTQNFGSINGYSFQYDPGLGGFAFRKWVGGSEIATPIAFAKAPAGYDWYAASRNLQISVSGSTFSATLDGQTVLTTTDRTYTDGGMGFRTWDSTKASFDNVIVRRIH
jgi:fructan beta-fructosidase